MASRQAAGRLQILAILMLLYGAASLLHFAHNAIFVDVYPNLPASISAARVWLAWIAVASLGAVGYLLMRCGHTLTGLSVAAIYAGLGFDGLLHYGLAPVAAHTWAMNLTIWAEVAMAAVLTVALAICFFSHLQQRSLPAR